MKASMEFFTHDASETAGTAGRCGGLNGQSPCLNLPDLAPWPDLATLCAAFVVADSSGVAPHASRCSINASNATVSAMARFANTAISRCDIACSPAREVSDKPATSSTRPIAAPQPPIMRFAAQQNQARLDNFSWPVAGK